MRRSRYSELGRRLGNPDQQPSFQADTEWPSSNFVVTLGICDGLFYQSLHDGGSCIEMQNAFGHRPFARFRLFGELFRRQA